MGVIIWLFVFVVSSIAAFGAANWASVRSKAARNVMTFLLAAAAAYSTSFVVDIWTQAASGDIPGGGNVIYPSITWLIIALVGSAASVVARGSMYAAALPFVIVAALALMVSGTHKQNLIVGIVFIGLTVITALVQWKSLRRLSRDVRVAATQPGVQADRP